MRAPTTDAPAAACGVGRAEVRRPAGGGHLGRQPFELAAADVFEVLARGVRRGLLVEKDRDLKAFGDRGADVLRERHAFGHRDTLDRNERHDIDGAETRMLAPVLPQVDGVERDGKERQRRRLDRRRVAGQREDGAVVGGVGRMVEQANARRLPDGLREALDDVGAAALADVGDRFDDRHAPSL